jgi:WD40 repeat protein
MALTEIFTMFMYICQFEVWLGYGSGLGTIYAYSVASVLPTLAGLTLTGHTSSVNAFVQLNSNQVATASSDNTIRVWNIDTRTLVNTYYGHTGILQAVAVLPGGLLVSCSLDSTLRVWNMSGAQTVSVQSVSNVQLMRYLGGNLVVKLNQATNTLATFSPATLDLQVLFGTGATSYNDFDALVLSGNIIAGGVNILDVYNSASGGLIQSNTCASGTIVAVRLLPDNVTVVCGLATGPLVLFNANTNAFGSLYSVQTDYINYLAVTPDQASLLSGSNDQTLTLWSWSTGSLTQVKMWTVAGQVQSAVVIQSPFTGCMERFLKYFFFNLRFAKCKTRRIVPEIKKIPSPLCSACKIKKNNFAGFSTF